MRISRRRRTRRFESCSVDRAERGLARRFRTPMTAQEEGELERKKLVPEAASAVAARIRKAAHPLTDHAGDDEPLLRAVGDASYVLLGEASHGTHEFYRERAEITKRLIEEKGFSAVAVEADWPDAYRVNRYVRGIGEDREAVDALSGFRRFPTWMWRNADVLDFIGWLREHNSSKGPGAAVGFYGLDLYSLLSSIAAVLEYLDKVD